MSQSSEGIVPHMGLTDKTILFDGVCKLCNAWCNFIIRHDHSHQFKLARVQSPEGQAILQHFDYPLDSFSTMLVIDGRSCLEKSTAFFYVMKRLGFPWRLITIFQFIPQALRDWLYDRIAFNRYYWFGRCDYCQLPNPDHKSRYLD